MLLCKGWYGWEHIQDYRRWEKNILVVCTAYSTLQSLQIRPLGVLILGSRVSDCRKQQESEESVLFQIS